MLLKGPRHCLTTRLRVCLSTGKVLLTDADVPAGSGIPKGNCHIAGGVAGADNWSLRPGGVRHLGCNACLPTDSAIQVHPTAGKAGSLHSAAASVEGLKA